jgi:hypothetical protein
VNDETVEKGNFTTNPNIKINLRGIRIPDNDIMKYMQADEVMYYIFLRRLM